MNETTCLAHLGLVEQIRTVCIKLEAQDKLNNERFNNIDKGINAAKIEMDRRLEAMNEFRKQLSEQADTFISRETVELRLSKIEEDIDNIQQYTNVSSGSDKWRDHLVMVFISLAVFLLAHFLFKF